jgi:hypothetical protein
VVTTGVGDDGVPIACSPGPDCTYHRYFADPDLADAGLDLLSQGITDGDSFARAFVGQLVAGGAWIVVLTTGGALVAGGIRAVRAVPADAARTGVSSA